MLKTSDKEDIRLSWGESIDLPFPVRLRDSLANMDFITPRSPTANRLALSADTSDSLCQERRINLNRGESASNPIPIILEEISTPRINISARV